MKRKVKHFGLPLLLAGLCVATAAYAVDTKLFVARQPGGMFSVYDAGETATGRFYWVDSEASLAGDSTGKGRNPLAPFATLDYAIGVATASRGDIIYIAPGHSETLTAVVTVDKIGLTIIGQGQGTLRPQFTINANIDGITITAADCVVKNLYFNERTNAHTATINVAAANAVVENVHFDCGANDLESITIEAAGDYLTVKDCDFVVTADGPDAAVEIEAASVDGLVVEDCVFNGGSATNAWDAAAVNSTVAHTNCTISGNEFRYSKANQSSLIIKTSPSTLVGDNTYSEGAAQTQYDPRSWYVDSGGGTDNANRGTSIINPVATLDYAINLCAASSGDVIYVLPGHAETLVAAVTLDVVGVNIIGMGEGAARPAFTINGVIDGFTVTAANCTIENLYFNEATAAATAHINISAANTTVRGCHFDLGTNDLETITIADAGDYATIDSCVFIVTAEGPDAAIEVEADGVNGLVVRDCLFDGGSATNAWDAAAVNSAVVHTNCVIHGNRFLYDKASQAAMIINASANTLQYDNVFEAGAAPTTYDPRHLYVDSGSGLDNAGRGFSINSAFATLDYAIGLAAASNGDVIHVLPGHAETLTTVITMDVAGLSVIGMGEGTARPTFTINAVIDGMTVTAANCIIENLYFNEATAAATASINVAGANTTIKGCHFDIGATDLEVISVEDAGDYLTVTGCEFIVTADGPDAAIEVEAAGVNGLVIRDNLFDGGSATNAWDAAAVNSTQAHTNCVIHGNRFLYDKTSQAAMIINASASTMQYDNVFEAGAAPTAYDPRNLYVDSGGGLDNAGRGFSITNAVATIDYAINLAAASNGDVIYVLPGHAETVTTSITMDVIGVTVIGMGTGTARPTITVNDTVDGMTITAANCTVENLYFNEATAAATASINVGGANTVIKNCHFDIGANDIETITVEDAGDYLTVVDCEFIVTADGSDAAVEIESAAVVGLVVHDCLFDGGSATNAWDAAAINSTVAHTNCVIHGNRFLYDKASQAAMIINASASTLQFDNVFEAGAAPTTYDPRSLYVDSGGGLDGVGRGFSITSPVATIDYAIGLAAASNGDVIYVLPGHAETITVAVTVDVIGIKIVGMGEGTSRPTLTVNDTVDGMTITAANCTVENLYFNEATAVATASINVAAANTTIVDCHFDLGANDAETITVEDAGDSLTITGCEFVVTADGPDAAVEVESANVVGLVVQDCMFDGGSATNAWDAAAINSTVAHTNCAIHGNRFLYDKASQAAMIVNASASTQVYDNIYEAGAAPTTYDPRDLYVDSGAGLDNAGRGFSITSPLATLDYAIALAAASNGDVIHVLPGHAETLAAVVTVDVIGISILGMGEGTARPTFTVNDVIDGITVTAANCTIENLYFNEATAAATASINAGAANLTVRSCHFDLGANDIEAITVEDAGDGLVVEGCVFITTADGPDAAIEIEAAACDNITIRRNLFNGGSATNAWDAATINAAALATTNVRIYENRFLFSAAGQAALILPASVSTSCWENFYGGACRPSVDTPITIYAADGRTAVGQGTLEDPTTIVDAVDRATAAGDTVLLLPGTYTITVALAADVAGTTIKAANGLGTVEIAEDTDDTESIVVTGIGVVIEDIIFTKGIANSTDGKSTLNVDASRCIVRNCVFDLEARANADAINIATGTANHVITGCMFTSGAVGKSYIADASSSSRIIGNHFDSSAAVVACYEQIASPGDGLLFKDNTIVSAGAGAVGVWTAAPGRQSVVGNTIVGTAGDDDCFGDDADNDPFFIDNFRDGANDGTSTALDSSKT